jgi:hypothetical protein
MGERSSDRPTIAPEFDVEQFARDTDSHVANLIQPARVPTGLFPTELPTKPAVERRIPTRPQWGQAMSHEGWARSLAGAPVVAVGDDALKRLPLDHRAGFVMSLMDGSIDLDTIVELCGMERNEALGLIRDLYESGVVVFR